jgi:gamma-glutamylcyclotransferase (GGCT)/AIG2-like uncharacterized protein YtfP
MNLFAYGTLMDIDILASVAGSRPGCRAAVLSGYGRKRVSGEVYPALVEEQGGRVEGVLYLDFPEPAWPRLDRFEGEMYRRIGVHVLDAAGGSHPAETYLCRPEFTHLLTKADWSFEEFLKSGKKLFEDEYQGFTEIEE